MMTNDELKKKILEIFEKAIGDWYEKDDGLFAEGYTPEEGDNRLKAFMADALIEAGLKFDTVVSHTATFDMLQQNRINELEKRIVEAEHRAESAEHELERRLAEATKAMYVYERALYYATLNGETADEVKYNDALKRAQKDFAENKGD